MAIHETASSGSADHGTPVVARRVEDSQRLRRFRAISGIASWPSRGRCTISCAGSRPTIEAGFWDFIELSNGGFYMAPQHEGTFRFSVDTNGYEGEMSPDAAGITVCLFAYSHLSFRYPDDTFSPTTSTA